ncbi:biotin--[acetyl-CoA-carboxylase] ligase [Akkermansiaceae bacterium]|nr:biotin--[acetyl-CoA-carboxylase] ligase [Akkermansiaceae bacterium]
MPDPFRVLWRETVSSTNDELRALAEKGMAEGLVLVAEEQLAGRGRRGAEWFSPKGESLAFSVLLKPCQPKAFWPRLALVAGLAVAEALDRWVPLAEIKWPNDVMVGRKKIAGILVEAGADFVIVGIGINVNSTGFPPGLAATSMVMERGGELEREEVLLEVVTRLAHHVGNIGAGFDRLLGGVRERCFLTGHRVTLKCADKVREGCVRGIGAGGELLLEADGKTEAIFQADEVRLFGERG